MNTIYKTSYIIIGCALMLSSCAQEEAPTVLTDGGDRRIVFHTSLPEVTTKATEVVDDLPHFFMTAFDETDNLLIVGDTLKGFFYHKKFEKESDNKFLNETCVWPDPGKESDRLHFFAYYPALKLGATTGNGTSVNGNDKTIGYRVNGFQVAPDIADQVDFVTAYATGSMADNLFTGISLNFRHQLSRIQVMAKGSHKSCDIEIAGVRIENAFMNGNYEFQTSDTDGEWKNTSKGTAEYIYRYGDVIVTVGSNPVSILGKKIDDDNDNCAMLIPSTCSAWDFGNDSMNVGKGMYLNVLLRIIDKTPTSGKGKQQYPYFDKSQGLNALNIPVVYLVVDKATGKNVFTRIYKKDSTFYSDEDSTFYSDEDCTVAYVTPADKAVKEFGWAALPISAEWQPGYTYTYTLDYTSGVGLHGPEITGTSSPKAGDPIISDRVGVSISVNGWQGGDKTTHDFEVPGS